MKIIFVNRYFHPDQSATSRVVSGLAFSLARRSAEVTVLASRHPHDRPDTELPAYERIDGVDIHRLAGTGFGRHRLLGRAADYLTFHLSVARWLALNARGGDICVLCTDPPLLSLTASLALAPSGATMVNWVLDLFPEVATELGVISPSSLIARAALGMRDWTSRRAALTVCPIERMARYLEERGAPADRLAVVHLWSDGDEIYPVPPHRNRLRQEWGLGDKFVVGYSGNFGRAHEFDTLLDAAALLGGDDRIRFLMIGDGKKRAYVESEVKRRGLANIVMKPLQPKSVLAESLCASDIHLVSLLPQLEHCIIPSKFYGILAAGRPVCFIGDRHGEVAVETLRNGCGAAVGIGEPTKLAAEIRSFCDDPQRLAEASAASRRLFETHYMLERGVRDWLAVLERIGAAWQSAPAAPGEVEAVP